jgi:hypothetical protein
MDAMLQSREEEIVVVLDNVHRSAVEPIRSIVTATSKICWILLSQPGTVPQSLAGLLDTEVEVLGGWTLDSIAAEFDDAHLKVNPELAKRLQRMTGGLPLFVKHAATLATREYRGDVAEMCNQLEAGTHSEQTLQETILSRVYAGQTPTAQYVAALLSLSDVPLTPEEGIEMVSVALGKPASAMAAEVRSLALAAIVKKVAHRLEMHDSMRIVAASGIGNLPDGAQARGLKCLKDIIQRSLQKNWIISRQFFLLKLLPRTGNTEQLIGLATTEEEMFVEMGFTAQVQPVLTVAVDDATLPIRDRFLALDTLVYWGIQCGDVLSVAALVPKLAELFEQTEKRKDDLARLRIKQMFLAGINHDADLAIKVFDEACKAASDDAELLLILRYDLATILFKEGRYKIAEAEAAFLVKSYYKRLGTTPRQVFMAQQDEVYKMVKAVPDWSRLLRRLADTLELLAMVQRAQGKQSVMACMHAHKFFLMTWGLSSAVRVGQEWADEMIGFDDGEGALEVIENFVLQIVEKAQLLAYLVQVRAQRAVILAYCGRFREATDEIVRLMKFDVANPRMREELENQSRLIGRIVAGEIPLKLKSAPFREFASKFGPMLKSKLGRNDKCPCGSGKKFNRCCGA